MKFNHWINENTNNGKGLGLSVFDLDETLFKTFAQVIVMNNNKVAQKLSNSEFNSYKLKDGESFSFVEFRSSKIFKDTSVPIENTVNLLNTIIKKVEKKGKGSKVIILTARSNMDNKDLFLSKFRETGIDIDKIYIERAGSRGDFNIKEIKRKIIEEYLSDGLYTRVRIFDDFLPTCKEFLKLRDELSQSIIDKVKERYDIKDNNVITFTAYHVQPDGTIKEIK